MTIGRPQISKEIDIFNEGGEVLSPQVQSYYERMKAASESQDPTSFDSISKRASELSRLFPAPRRGTFGDLALALSKGLAQQAASGRPSSLGYGLAAGFNFFNEAEAEKRAVAEGMRQKLMLMAYEDIEKKKAESLALRKSMIEADFDYRIEEMKRSGGLFDSKTVEAQAWNFILEAEKNPELKKTPQYRVARSVLEKPRRSYQQTEQGTVMIEQPGYDVSRVLPEATAPVDTSRPEVPEGFTATGKYKDGKMVYQRNNPNTGAVEYGVF